MYAGEKAGKGSQSVEAGIKASLIFSVRVGGVLLALAAGALGMVLAPGASAAKVCGGDVACACGDTVRGVAVLQSDLGICTGLGLAMSTGSVLDCAGHTITGTDPLPGEWYGIELDTVTGEQVRDCRVTAFRRGLRVFGGGGHTLVGNEILLNKYGIDLAGQTTANRIEGNVIRDSRDEGIHVGTGARDNLIVGNQIVGNKLENVYLLEASGTRVIGNVIVDAGNAAIFIKHSTGSYVADNVVWNTGIQLRGNSWGNVLEHNELRGDGYVFEAYYQEDDAVWTYPHRNQVSGGTVFNAGACVRMFGAYDNRVQGVRVDDDCAPPFEEVRAGDLQPFDNVFELTVTEPGPVGSRSAVQVSTNARELHAGDVITLGLAVHNGPTNVPLDLYVGVLFPDNRIGFFTSPERGGFGPAMVPLQSAPPGFSLTLPRFVDVALPAGTPPGTYQFFAAFLVPTALADGVITASEVVAFDLESFTVHP